MRVNHIPVNGTEDGIDFEAHYTVDNWGKGIAFYLLGWLAVNVPQMCYALDEDGNEIEIESGDYEEEADRDRVVAVMVGDDRRHVVRREDLQLLPEDGFCRSCGQVGCGCNVYT